MIYLATNNAHKCGEIRSLFKKAGLEGIPAPEPFPGGMPWVDETAGTFAGNAALKARALKAVLPSGASALADDSGLCVNALDGAPGVHSARYAGVGSGDAANNEKLLHALDGAADRSAFFLCVFLLIDAAGKAHVFEGRCYGKIATEADGAAGFGYDPLFVPDGYGRSFAALGQAVKEGISHRARAFEPLAAHLRRESS